MGKIAGAILQAALRANGFLNKPSQPLQQQQQKVLYQLLQRAAHTAFGKHYLFSHWLTMPAHEQYQAFAQTIPLHTYEQMFTQWWHRIITGEPSVCWPGITRYMALTSGTSMAGSKYIPLTPQSMSSVKQAGLQLATALAARPGLSGLFGLKTISIGGSTRLSNQGAVQVGDFSGIMMRQNPGWYQRLIIPPPAIHALKQWPQKLEYLVECAPQFNPGSVSGFPVWVVPLLQAIISRYKLAHIHQLWPGLQVYLYGGMAVQPYQSSLQACFGKP
ncbi:MAG TPA: GH3 auxin-responsive promoter family protein, partial [Phnomibacter sp.]|nr:GH3 auxin-responsive promoter family protein [Phnomibacter sp.]